MSWITVTKCVKNKQQQISSPSGISVSFQLPLKSSIHYKVKIPRLKFDPNTFERPCLLQLPIITLWQKCFNCQTSTNNSQLPGQDNCVPPRFRTSGSRRFREPDHLSYLLWALFKIASIAKPVEVGSYSLGLTFFAGKLSPWRPRATLHQNYLHTHPHTFSPVIFHQNFSHSHPDLFCYECVFVWVRQRLYTENYFSKWSPSIQPKRSEGEKLKKGGSYFPNLRELKLEGGEKQIHYHNQESFLYWFLGLSEGLRVLTWQCWGNRVRSNLPNEGHGKAVRMGVCVYM